MRFDPSILIILASIITVIGMTVGTLALLAEHREKKAARASELLREKLTRAVLSGYADGVSANKTLSTSRVHIEEFDASIQKLA